MTSLAGGAGLMKYTPIAMAATRMAAMGVRAISRSRRLPVRNRRGSMAKVERGDANYRLCRALELAHGGTLMWAIAVHGGAGNWDEAQHEAARAGVRTAARQAG